MAYQISDKAKAIHERLNFYGATYLSSRERFDEFTSNQENLWKYPDGIEGPKIRSQETELWILTQRICSLESWLNKR